MKGNKRLRTRNKTASSVPKSNTPSTKVRQLCPHNSRKRECKECEGSVIFHHNHCKRVCTKCGGSAVCHHGHQKALCKECLG